MSPIREHIRLAFILDGAIMNISNMKMKQFEASLFLFMIPVIIVFVTFLLTETLGLISK
jgi:hypothetical protein